jgi:tetratricopeptide (TPR) repeat protein
MMLPMASPPLLGDRFELGEKIASGGMGTVFRGRDLRTGESVAVKVLEGGGRLTARFEREVLALERLRHPGVVRYVAHGESDNGNLFLAMEWLTGEDLQAVLQRGPLGVRDALMLAKRVAEALGEGHRRGVIHRDVKPSNLFLVGRDPHAPKILDFGVARLTGGTRGVTHTGILVGTPGYLAPEQARGDTNVDARADVFSLGCVLFECIAGRPAFEADRVLALLAKVLFAGAPRLSEVAREVPEPVDDFVAELLAADPAGRPHDGNEVASRVGELLEAGVQGPQRRSSRPAALGDLEQQLLSVVVAADARAADARTMSMGDMDERHAALRAVATAFGAKFEPVVDGSAVMTLAGRGDAREQAARAARCALAAHRAAPDLAVAVATGSGVMAGPVPVGEVIDRAVAVVDSAGIAVCADEVTAGLLPEEFDVVEEGATRVVRAQTRTGAAGRTLLGRNVPCVGRTRELRMLDAVAGQAFEDGAAGVVLITGPAGAGKSRVRDELVTRLRGRGIDVWQGRAEPMRTGSPFSVIVGALSAPLGIAQERSLAQRRKQLADKVAAVVKPEDAGRVAPFLAELLGVPFPSGDDVRLSAARGDPELMSDQLRLAVVDLAGAWCATRPLAIVLEDLQWADAPSIRVVDQLLVAARELPLLVVGVARPEVYERFPDLWARRVPQEIRIGPLPRRAAEELVRTALGEDTDAAVVQRLLDASQGNAFFLEELIRAEAAGRGEQTPPTVLAVVRARLEAMEPDARRVMRAASVFGRRFWREGVAALVGRDVDPWIERLEEREVLARRADGASPEQAELTFRHDLLRDAAYAMLTADDRRLGHRLAAKWLAVRTGVEAIVLAEHFELGGEPERAAPLWVTAAEEALEGNDLDGCLSCVARAGSDLLSPEERGRVRLVEAEAQVWRGNLPAAEAAATEAVALLPRGSDDWCHALMELATARSRFGAHAIENVAEELLAATDVEQLDMAVCSMLARLALALRHGGLPAVAKRVEERVRRAAGDEADPAVRGWLHRLAASEALFDGDIGTYLAEEIAARDCFTAIGAARRSVLSAVNVGYAMLELGAYAEAERALGDAIETTRRIGLGQLETVAQQNLGRAVAANGRLREALAIEQTAASRAAQAGDVRLEGAALIYLSQIHFALGELEEAEAHARRAVARLEPLPTLAPYARAVLARTLLARGDTEGALAASEDAERSLVEVGELEEGETLVWLVRAEALGAAGREHDAAVAARHARRVVDARAARIRDDTLRESFLARVDDNARVLALAAPPG